MNNPQQQTHHHHPHSHQQQQQQYLQQPQQHVYMHNPSLAPQHVVQQQHQNVYMSTAAAASSHQLNQTHKLYEIIQQGLNRPKITIRKGPRGFGFTIGAIRVYYDDSDHHSIQHLVMQTDQDGPAYAAGLRVNDVITHVNEEVVCGRQHTEIIKLIMSKQTINLNVVQLSQTSIKKGGRLTKAR
jgi:C-terminal processing protease CtpA/Prc